MTTFGALPVNAIFVRVTPGQPEVLRVKTDSGVSRVISMVTSGARDLILIPGPGTGEQSNQPVQLIDADPRVKVVT